MPAESFVLPAHRLSTAQSADAIRRKLTWYSGAAVLCATLAAFTLAWQAFSSPYPVPAPLQLLVTLFLLVAVCIRFGLTRYRWYEVRQDGLHYHGAWKRTHLIPWTAMEDLRYMAGLALPFSIKVKGRRAPIRLGLPHPDLQGWTDDCLKHMTLDLSRGGPLPAYHRPALFWVCASVLTVAVLATPLGILRALNGASDMVSVLLPTAVVAAGCARLIRRPLHWDPAGIRLGRWRPVHAPWDAVRAEWRPTMFGGAALFLRLANGPTVCVSLNDWGAPRFVARLGELDAGIATPPITRAGVASTGLLFPIMLAIVTLIGGIQLRESARLIGGLAPGELWAGFGHETTGQIVSAQLTYRGIEVRYVYEAYGKRHRGRGWLLGTARPALETSLTLPVLYAPGVPSASLLRGDPTVFYAIYYGLFGLFHLILVLPLVALWDLVPPPEPFTVPCLAS